MKDEQILDYLKAGNYTKAGEKLYGYFPVVQKLVLKNNGSKQDAEDIYQEALIILIRKIQSPGFILSSSLNTYIYSVCRFLWNDQLKKKNKSIETDIETTLFVLKAEEIENDTTENENKLAEKAFNELGEKCKQLLQLFYFNKISLKEIATKLGFNSEKVAKNQKYRCLEKAKENLKTLKSFSHE
ncbi:MAG: sigma-70 family RNA polymerase sigma factor [Bacteroidetes bacterium]|nr:sigma-70 family RNA polymerase sigma factor [Bacteroidota bacterium]